MSIATVTDLVEALCRYPLLEAAQREELDGVLHAQYTEPRTLARELVLRGWLTPFQLNTIFQGHVEDLVLGSYVLVERLTEGAVGQLFRARHQHMKRAVALQVIRPELLKNADAVERFYQEIQAVSRLSHQHLVAAYDAGPVRETHFFAMEYVEGIDLDRLVQQEGPLSASRTAEYLRQAALGLQHAFERGLLHYDLKPANLIVTRTLSGQFTDEAPNPERMGRRIEHTGVGWIKVRNLGLTLIRQHTRHTRLQPTEPLAGPAPDFLAPERQGDAACTDVRAEMYSLGCTFYYLLTGQVPFPGGSAEEKAHRHQHEEAVPVEKLQPKVPAEMAAIVRRLMAKQSEERPGTPREVAELLSAWTPRGLGLAFMKAARNGNHTPAVLEPTFVTPEADHPDTKAPPAVAPPPARRWRPLILVGGALVPLFALAAAFLFWPGRPVVAPLTIESDHAAVDEMTVEANRAWQDTFVDVTAGEPILILARGRWRSGPRASQVTADGDSGDANDRTVLRDAPAMCLVGRIGSDEPPFVLGVHKNISPRAGGRLFVQANALDLQATSGSLVLQIKGGKRNPVPAIVWQYGHGEFDDSSKRMKGFQPLPFWPAANRWQGGPQLPAGPLGWVNGIAAHGHPGPTRAIAHVRRWQVPRDGLVAVRGTLHHPSGAGDGVCARLVSSRLGEVGGPWIAQFSRMETSVPRLLVKLGDTIDAVVDCRSTDLHDAFDWPVFIEWLPEAGTR